MEISKTQAGVTAGIFILMATALTITNVTPEDKFYTCESSGSAGHCFKISEQNEFGLSTRCYYNESAPLKYKACSSGWELLVSNEFNVISSDANSESSGEPLLEVCYANGCIPIKQAKAIHLN